MINNGKAKIEKTLWGLIIVTPSKKNWFTLFFGTAWMGGWFFGFVTVLRMLLSSNISSSGADGFIIFWLLAWTVGGCAISLMLLWGYFGKEKFILHNDELIFEKSILGLGKKTRLEKVSVKNFRTEFVSESLFGGNRLATWGLGAGKIKFDYGLKTYSFGLSLDDAEANYIVRILKEQFNE